MLFSMALGAKCSSQWFLQSRDTSGNVINKVSFVDSLTGWAVGDRGLILHTTDSGNHWMAQTSGITSPLFSISFSDQQNGWAVGAGGTLITTTNGGTSWVRVIHDTSGNIYNYKVQYLSPTTVFVLRDNFADTTLTPYRLWKSTDRGASWIDISPVSNYYRGLYDFCFLSPLLGWTCGNGGQTLKGMQIHRTTDGGQTWSLYDCRIPTTMGFMSVYFRDANEGWAVADSCYHSTDGGATWSALSWLPNGINQDFVMFGEIGYATQMISRVMKTTNGGRNWQYHPIGPDNSIMSISFTSPNVGWAVTLHGQFYHTTNGGVTEARNRQSNNGVVTEYSLLQNYPNPFNPVTHISFSIEKTEFVSIEVYSSLGTHVTTLVSGVKPPGSYTTTFNGEKLSSGVYFYVMKTNNSSIIKSMILMK